MTSAAADNIRLHIKAGHTEIPPEEVIYEYI